MQRESKIQKRIRKASGGGERGEYNKLAELMRSKIKRRNARKKEAKKCGEKKGKP